MIEMIEMRKVEAMVKNERGMALIIALFVVVILMLMGGLFLTVSMTESNISSNERNHSQAFQFAEAGVEHARRALMRLSPTGVLNGTPVFGGSNTAALGTGTYTVQVRNNIASEGFPRGNIERDVTAGEGTFTYSLTDENGNNGVLEFTKPIDPGTLASLELKLASSHPSWSPPPDCPAECWGYNPNGGSPTSGSPGTEGYVGGLNSADYPTPPADSITITNLVVQGGGCIATATQDCDRILVVESTGNFQGTQKTIEAVIQVPVPGWGALYVLDGADTPPSEVAEMEDFEATGGSRIDGNDCAPGGALGSGTGPDTVGIAINGTDAEGDIEASLDPAEAFGVTGMGGQSGDNTIEVAAGGMSDADFDIWWRNLKELATSVGVAPCDGPYGTPASPQICHLNGNVTTSIPANSSGAGILIVNDVTPLGDPVTVGANFDGLTYQGIIIVVGDGRFRVEGDAANPVRIYGTVLQRNYGGHSGETRLRVRGDSTICYSNEAIRTAHEALLPSVLAWYEK
ncbi:MAG: PilX N-terminal domain-containing pilus assembly protein [Candidatus Methylomirabilales bacterium]